MADAFDITPEEERECGLSPPVPLDGPVGEDELNQYMHMRQAQDDRRYRGALRRHEPAFVSPSLLLGVSTGRVGFGNPANDVLQEYAANVAGGFARDGLMPVADPDNVTVKEASRLRSVRKDGCAGKHSGKSVSSSGPRRAERGNENDKVEQKGSTEEERSDQGDDNLNKSASGHGDDCDGRE